MIHSVEKNIKKGRQPKPAAAAKTLKAKKNNNDTSHTPLSLNSAENYIVSATPTMAPPENIKLGELGELGELGDSGNSGNSGNLNFEALFPGIYNKLNYFLKYNKIPHLIFHGSSGSGKKTIVYDFIHKIYKNDKLKIKSNVMFVNCSHGKGIKFIRDELKFFAKTNIQINANIVFKTIVLLNADYLTIDAQSALRRCIELFSYNTRFFIIVENKHKLLNPILSRFCEIFVPELYSTAMFLGRRDGIVFNNLHQYKLQHTMNNTAYEEMRRLELAEIMLQYGGGDGGGNGCKYDLINEIYMAGFLCLDIMKYFENNSAELGLRDFSLCYIEFNRVKTELRCEKILMLYMFNFIEKSL